MEEVIKVFVSYSWDSDKHTRWVKSLADKLISDGIDVCLDQYDLDLGDRLPHFMEQKIAESKYVLIICTPNYKKKSDQRLGGVGYEGHIISGELLSSCNEKKFIPVLREGSFSAAIPRCLDGKYAIDLSENQNFDDDRNYKDLLTTLYGSRVKPSIGTRPSYVPQSIESNSNAENNLEGVKILGIVADEVTTPKMDGTRGSALYTIPFRLSKLPSLLWEEVFIRTWNSPPSFTTMHRPGIASVLGEKIYLNGTTIEEVKKFHRDTLYLCVETANRIESLSKAEEERLQKKAEEEKRNFHQRIQDAMTDIDFNS